MSEFNQRIIEIVDKYKKNEEKKEKITANSNLSDLNLDTMTHSTCGNILAKEMADYVIEEYNKDAMVMARAKQEKCLIEQGRDTQIIENMFDRILFAIDSSFEHQREGNKLKKISSIMRLCKKKLRGHNNMMYLIEDTMYEDVLTELIILFERKSQSPDGKTEFLMKDIAQYILYAFNEIGISLADVRKNKIPTSPLSTFVDICKKPLGEHLEKEQYEQFAEYFSLDGFHEAIRTEKKSYKKQ